MNKRFLNMKQVEELLGISERTIYRIMQKGDLKGFKTGRAWRFEESDIEDYIKRQREKAEAQLKADEAA